MSLLFSHYNKEIVKREIYNFSKQRWIALYGSTMFRYDKQGNPLVFENEDSVAKKISEFKARTVYATAGKYEEVTKDNIEKDNLLYYTPFFDIDTKIDKWEYAVKAAEVIVSQLEKEGVEKSIYLLWSGEGIHVRINENSIPKDYYPLTAAHAIVQYIIEKSRNDLQKLSESSGGVLKVDELIDSKRIFTAPLSFHRELNYVAVCFSPDKLSKFSLDWANPQNFIHEEGIYERYEENETEDLLTKAIQSYKPSHEGVKPRKRKVTKTRENTGESMNEAKIGRFQVMGIVQAARYYVLYGNMDKAKSFGLNRAIFYAWAKYYGKGYAPKYSKTTVPSEFRKDRVLANVAGEQVYQDTEKGYYIIGDKMQTPEDYDREIKDKIEPIISYDKAWDATIKYVSSFPKEVLENQREFFEKVYLPIRDKFIEKVINRKSGLDAFFSS
ncbi:hypothetical protein [Acidianus brierleyi]|uniref:hypothetical protein n=1 Tax=Acidianus brierleyi TaxID=41673 RepID=UPI001B316B89|nr:hypothetical protein [Acidianus brierleyi]